MKKDWSTAPTKRNSGYYCYIGPSIKNVIQSETIYIGTKKQAFQKASKAIERYPAIKMLIVSGDDLADARRVVKQSGTSLNALYMKVLRGK